MTDSASDKFSLPCEITDCDDADCAATTDCVAEAAVVPHPLNPSPGSEAGQSQREGDVPGIPSESWQARGLAHPAGRGWKPVVPLARGGRDGVGDGDEARVPLHHAVHGPADASRHLRFPRDGEDESRALFTRERQVAFLHALAACGAVRRAAAQIGISYRTVYRERRASVPFRRAWDAALLSARALSEDVLATRALDGVEEEVWYHGEVVATRRRYDSRLLLAHLARLDRLTEDARTRAFADDYEGALERFAAGIDDPVPVCAGCGEALPPDCSPGLCDKCDITPSSSEAVGRVDTLTDTLTPAPEPEERDELSWIDDPRYDRWPDGSHRHRIPPPGYGEWEADMDDPAHWVNGEYIPPLGRALRDAEEAGAGGAEDEEE